MTSFRICRHYYILFYQGKDPVGKGRPLANEVIKLLRFKYPYIFLLVIKNDVPKDTMPLLMDRADCLLVTSISEGSPLIVKESLAMGLPIVSVDVGDVAEMTKGVKHCYIVERNAQKLADAIKEILG